MRSESGKGHLSETIDYETVYNIQVSEHHTYFVGEDWWPFAVWAHNTNAECTIPSNGSQEQTEAVAAPPKNASYTFKSGKRAGQTVDFGVPERQFKFVKQNDEVIAILRKEFNKTAKPNWIKEIATNEESKAALKKAGISEAEIKKMAESGKPPVGYQVHHIDPLDGGGQNVSSNFILAKQDPQHQAMTATHIVQTASLKVGESVEIVLPKLDGIVFPSH